MSFSIYITYWDNDPLEQIQRMIDHHILTSNTRVILAFASFNFISNQCIPGFGSITKNDVNHVINLVHSVGATISLSIGGATYSLIGSDLYSHPEELAENISGVLNTYGFDGVDFDIEDSTVPDDFAETAASIIRTMRSLHPSVYMTLTTPGQAWSKGQSPSFSKGQSPTNGMYQNLLNMTIASIDAWQPMEYDLWIGQPSYTEQIQWDIKYYQITWGIPYNKIILGLMCGQDDADHVLSLDDAVDLTDFAEKQGLKGVMMWDSNIDGKGCAGNAPFAYSLGIQQILDYYV
jgi:chitinase